MEAKSSIILIVEDDFGLNELVSERVSESGYETYSAYSAIEAIEWLKSNKPFMMVLDYSLGDLMANEFIQDLLSQIGYVPPFVVATGRGDERIAVEMMKLGARDYIVKDNNFLEMIPIVVKRVCLEIENEDKLKQVEQSLNQSREEFKDLYDNAPIGYHEIDLEGRIIRMNKTELRMLGYTFEELKDQFIWGLVTDKEFSTKVTQEKLKHYQISTIPYEREFVRKDGSKIPVLLMDKLIIAKNGEVSGIRSSIQDITERKEAQLEVERIGNHYQAIIEKSPDGCVLIGADGHFKYASPSSLRMFGYSNDVLLSIQPNDITHPDELPMVLENLGRLIHDPAFSPVLEYRFKHCNGNWIWIESTFSNLLDDDAVNSIVINFRDISERKQVEETLKIRETYLTAIIENLPGMIWLKDPESHIQLTNTKFAHTFGRENPEDLIGKTDMDFSPKEHAERYLADDKNVVTSKKPLHVEELIYDQSSIKWFETFKMPIFDENNQVIGIAGYAQDISVRKQAEKALVESEEKFKKAFTTSPDSININRMEDGMYVSINSGFTRIIGYSEEEIIGKTSIAINIWVDESDRDKLIHGLHENGVVENLVTQFRTKTGELVYGMMSASVIELNGEKHILSITRNVTEQKLAEALLNHERELYLDLVNTQPAGIYRIRVAPVEKWGKDAWSNSENSPYTIELASDRFCEILGITRNEFKKNPKIIFDLIHPDDQVEYTRRNEEANINKIPFYWDCRLLINGKVKWVHFESLPRQLLNGEIIFTGILYDISDRVLAQHALEESRDVLNKLLFASTKFIDSDAINHKGISDNLLEISGAKYVSFNLFDENGLDFTSVAVSGIDGLQDKMKSILGYDVFNKKWKPDPVRADKLKDKAMTRFDSFFELTGSVLPKKISTLVEKVFNLGEAWVVQITKNNVTIGDFTLLFTTGNTLKNREIIELYTTQVGLYIERVNSEEALRKSEDIYRNLVTKMPDGVYKSTPEGQFIDANPALVNMLGFESKEELMNVNIISDLYFSAADRDEILLSDNQNSGMSVFRMKKKDGTEIWIEDHGWYNTDKQGKTVSHEGVLRDITERKMAEDAIKASERMLREAQEVARLGSYDWNITTGYWTSSDILDGIFGIDETSDRSTEGWLALTHPEWQEIMSDYISNEVIGSRRDFDKEYKIIRQNDGKECWVHGLGQLECNQLNEPIRLVGTITNIDERKQAQIALEEKMNELIRFQNVTVGRELTMIELKKEINEMLKKMGQEPKYRIVD